MDKLAFFPTAAPDRSSADCAPPADGPAARSRSRSRPAAETGPLRAKFILVEDVDYLMRTGESRQVLAMRWVH